MTVGFVDADEADVCCQYMNERIWHGKVIQCQNWDGKFHCLSLFVFCYLMTYF